MVKFITDALAGAATGVLSGFGVGGGTLLMVYMTAFRGIEQRMAQGINLLYFLPCAGTSLAFHIKEHKVDKGTAVPALIAGVLTGVLGALVAHWLDTELLRRLFGGFLLVVGARELFAKKQPGPQEK